MSELLKVQVEDENGNIYYMHTSADVVFLDDGTSVAAKIEKLVEKSGGNISDTKIETVDTTATEFPVPSAGEYSKTFLGKVRKFTQDFVGIKDTLLTLSKLVNNGQTTASGFALDARYGKTLADQVTKLNTDFVSKFDDAIALEQQNQLIRFGKDKGNIINVSLSITSPVTWAGNPFIIATLPTEYRPRKIEYMVCYANSGVALIQIQTDGRIITYTQISNSLCYGSVVYLG